MRTLYKAAVVISGMALLSACATSETLSSVSSTLDTVTPDITLNQFIEIRMTAIQPEAAAGEGENLEALAELVGSEDKAAFAHMMQVNYSQLFDGLEQPTDLLARINNLQTPAAI